MAVYTTIDDPSAYFKVQLYTGDGGTNAITFDDTDTDMQPDFVWIKNRDSTDSHCLFDAVRGATKVMNSDLGSTAETTDTDTLTAFGSDGFTVGADVKVNTNTEKYVAWCWKESATSGFDIVNYSGNQVARTISHSLSAVPHLLIVRSIEAARNWAVYHHKNTAAPETDYLVLDNNAATIDNVDYWNDTAPTSSVFTIGTDPQTNWADPSAETYRSYLFTGKQGFSKFGTYEGNGNANGPFVFTDFRPAFIMCKTIDSTGGWYMFDDQRAGYNVDNDTILADTEAGDEGTDKIDILSNGFKLRHATDPNVAETYVYAAFAKAPLANSNGVPSNAR